MKSLRNRLLLGASALITIGIFVSDAVIYSSVHSSLYDELDEALLDKARIIAGQTELADEGLEIDLDGNSFAALSAAGNPTFFQVWREDGSILQKSEELPGDGLNLATVGGTPEFQFSVLSNGARCRQVSFRYFPAIEEDLLIGTFDDGKTIPDSVQAMIDNSQDGHLNESVTLVVASSTEHLARMLARFRLLLILVGTGSLAVSLLLILWGVDRGLRPLNTVASAIESIDEHSLDQRIPIGLAPTEIEPIINRLNGLLERVQGALNRERAFSSDVSHELRTPLAGIKSTIEVCLSRLRSPDEYKESLRDCLKICRQSQRMVESLLAISKLENGETHVSRTELDLKEMVDECWLEFVRTAGERRVRLADYAVASMKIICDEDKLRVVLRNILHNAVSHCDEGGWIRVRSECMNGSVRISIENSGATVSNGDIPAVFDRFWRSDKSRAQTGDHFGLGLSLVRRLVDALNGRIDIRVKDNNFCVVLNLPTGLCDVPSVSVSAIGPSAFKD